MSEFLHLCRKHPFVTLSATLFTGLLAFSFALEILFTLRHTADFAALRLTEQGYDQVSILDQHTIALAGGLPSLPIENRFDFIATSSGASVAGKLICRRQVYDLERSRCEVELF